jgi:hypothetical protein
LSEQCAHQSPRQYALTYHAKSPIYLPASLPKPKSIQLSDYQRTTTAAILSYNVRYTPFSLDAPPSLNVAPSPIPVASIFL